jgi:uncharacterized protein (TIGR03435 family)
MKPTFLSVIVIFSWALSVVAQNENAGPKIGDAPPAFGLEKMLQVPEGKKLEWSALKGKVVVLEFWATWCGPCVAAIPHLNELADKFKDQPVQFVAVTDEDEKIIVPFLKRKAIHAWIGLDTDKSMFKAYGISGIPQTVIVDKKGKIVAITHPSSLTEGVLKEAIAGKKLSLEQLAETGRRGLRPGEVPYGESENQGKPSLFQVVIRPSVTNESDHLRMASGNGSLTFSVSSVFECLSSCYDINPVRILTNSAMPEGKFDFVVKTPNQTEDSAHKWLRQAVETAFGLRSKRETRDMSVYILSAPKPDDPRLPVTVSTGGSSGRFGPGGMQAVNQGIGSLAWYLETKLGKPVLDETALTNHYDFELKWKEQPDEKPSADTIVNAVREQLGLELTPATSPVEVVVVEKEDKSEANATAPKQ